MSLSRQDKQERLAEGLRIISRTSDAIARTFEVTFESIVALTEIWEAWDSDTR